MDIGRYKAVTKSLTLDFQGEVINLQIRPNVYTLGFTRNLRKLMNEDKEDVGALADVLSQVIASWDLLEDGQPIPITAEGLERVPLHILGKIDKAIGDALEIPSEEEKKGSSEPSDSLPPASTEPSTSSLPTSSNGSTTSESPTASESVPST